MTNYEQILKTLRSEVLSSIEYLKYSFEQVLQQTPQVLEIAKKI